MFVPARQRTRWRKRAAASFVGVHFLSCGLLMVVMAVHLT
jgi:hypothetical protein